MAVSILTTSFEKPRALKKKSVIFHFSLGYIYLEHAELSAILWKNGRRGRSISFVTWV